ncbi:MAG: hypothetical protein GF383_04255, partial [Candidatus Lokiarchaeota archaeon]|nr:hypothetical protein [Candidatus Lokiarchaeota archaeon]MBD3338970.1 hypothetical protein [Candidatus Lokiarchaeota archaeon]
MPSSRSSFKKKRIRSFFLSMETAEKGKEEIEKIHDQIEGKGLSYIQMKLPVAQITPEFEAQLQEKVDKNILHAKIREATEQDLPSVMQVYNRAWMTSNTPFSPINLESLKQIYDFQDTIILLAQVYGSDAGFIILDFEGPNKEFGIIAGLGVIPR